MRSTAPAKFGMKRKGESSTLWNCVKMNTFEAEEDEFMPKTITLRLDEKTYNLIRSAASGSRRSISNFIEYATVAYLAEDSFVADSEMAEILADTDLVEHLEQGRKDIAENRYTIVE